MGDVGMIDNDVPVVWRMGDAFQKVMPHHEGIKALWETKWKMPCSRGVYPFHDGLYEDFEPIFEHLIKNDINDPLLIEYSEAFIQPAKILARQAAASTTEENHRSSLYLRACALLRIARFPYISNHVGMNDGQREAWNLQKQYYLLAASRWTVPVEEIEIPYEGGRENEGASIPAYVRVPFTEMGKKVPVMLLMTGLDGYRPDNTARLDMFLARGWASVTCEIPGTADCPADAADAQSPDRLWSAVLSWIARHPIMDEKQVLVWGLSSGGYYAIRIAHTHAKLVKGVVAQGAGAHYFFDKNWNEKIEGHEYPFKIFPFIAQKYGYETKEEYVRSAQAKFSLLSTGILDMPCTKLLLVNGTHDGLMPIEDSILVLESGNAKSARFFPKTLHMGYPMANEAVYAWLDDLMG